MVPIPATRRRRDPSRPLEPRPRTGEAALQTLPEPSDRLPDGVPSGESVSLSGGTALRATDRADAGQGRRTACRPTTAGCSSPSGTASAPSCSATATRSTRSRATSSRSTATSRSWRRRCGPPSPSAASSTARSSSPRGRCARLRGAAAADPSGRVAGQHARRGVAGVVRRLGPAGARRRGPARRAAGRAAQRGSRRSSTGRCRRST